MSSSESFARAKTPLESFLFHSEVFDGSRLEPFEWLGFDEICKEQKGTYLTAGLANWMSSS